MVKKLILICCLLSSVQMSFGQEDEDDYFEEQHYSTHFVNEKYHLDFTTYLSQKNSDSLNQVLNDHVAYAKLVSLRPILKYKGTPENHVEYEEFESAIRFDRITKGVNERKFLNSVLVDSSSIKDIILLYYQKNMDSIQNYSVGACYFPRHGVVFYDINDEIIAYLEVCFECTRTNYIGIFPGYNDLTDKQFDNLKLIFKKYMLDHFEPTD